MVSRSCSSGRFSQGTQQHSFSKKAKNLMEDELQIQPQNVEDRILFMSMYNDIDWTAKDNRSLCEKHSSRVSEYARQSPMGSFQETRMSGAEHSPTNHTANGIEQGSGRC